MDITKNDAEVIRVERVTYRGREYINARLFVLGGDGTRWLPTKRGLTVDVPLARQVAEAMLEVTAMPEVAT